MSEQLFILDHHVDATSDINHPTIEYLIENVGSVTTLIVEKIREQCEANLREEESTLMALGIHSDTGSLTFDSTTTRDVDALCWLQGSASSKKSRASQEVIAEFCSTSVSGGR